MRISKTKNMRTKINVGDTIRIDWMDDNGGTDLGAARYCGRTGQVTFIDSLGQLHGTWGGLAVNLDNDIVSKIG